MNRIKPEWYHNNFSDEDQLLAACIRMISQEFPRLRGKVWHTRNEQFIEQRQDESNEQYQNRVRNTLGRYKTLGLLPGVHDILIVYKGILFKIELKQPGKKPSPEQVSLHALWDGESPVKTLVTSVLVDVYNYCKWILEDRFYISIKEK